MVLKGNNKMINFALLFVELLFSIHLIRYFPHLALCSTELGNTIFIGKIIVLAQKHTPLHNNDVLLGVTYNLTHPNTHRDLR